MNTENPKPMTQAEIDRKYPVPTLLKDADSRKVYYETIPLLCVKHKDLKPFMREIAFYCVFTALAERAVLSCADKPLVLDRRGNAIPNQSTALLKMYCTQQRQYADSLGISVKSMKRNDRMDKKDLGKRGSSKAYAGFIGAALHGKRNGNGRT